MLLVGLLTSVQLSLFTALYALVVLIALGVWVKPRLFNRRWDNPILTVVLLIALADAFGLVGIIVAPPFQPYAKSCGAAWSATALFQGLRPRFQTSKSGKNVYGTPSGRWMSRLCHW